LKNGKQSWNIPELFCSMMNDDLSEFGIFLLIVEEILEKKIIKYKKGPIRGG